MTPKINAAGDKTAYAKELEKVVLGTLICAMITAVFAVLSIFGGSSASYEEMKQYETELRHVTEVIEKPARFRNRLFETDVRWLRLNVASGPSPVFYQDRSGSFETVKERLLKHQGPIAITIRDDQSLLENAYNPEIFAITVGEQELRSVKQSINSQKSRYKKRMHTAIILFAAITAFGAFRWARLARRRVSNHG